MLAYSFYALLALLPFGIRYQEFLPLVVIALFIYIFRWPRGIWPKPLIAFLFFAAISAGIAHTASALSFLFWLMIAVAMAIVTAKILRMGIVRFERIAAVLAVSVTVQAMLGLLQFWKQRSIGLGFVGEAAISSANPETAKVIVEGVKLIRASGTLPHANIYAAFLVLGFLSLLYLWLRRPSELAPTPIGEQVPMSKNTPRLVWGWKRIMSDAILGSGIFITTLGLLISFSRTGWAVAAGAALTVTIGAIISRQYRRQGIRLFILLAAIGLMLNHSFHSYIVSRARVVPDEPSVTLRESFNAIGLEVVKSNVLGVGIGNQVSYAEKSGIYEKFGLTEPWQRQPVHNLYLLIAAETGILGALAFVVFIGQEMFVAARSRAFAGVMLGALLLFGLTDHFLWTYQSGRLMLWLTIGLVMGLNMARSERS